MNTKTKLFLIGSAALILSALFQRWGQLIVRITRSTGNSGHTNGSDDANGSDYTNGSDDANASNYANAPNNTNATNNTSAATHASTAINSECFFVYKYCRWSGPL